MIIPMKKLTLLLYHREKDAFLSSLQKLGVVDIEENVNEDECRSIEELKNTMSDAQRVHRDLTRIAARHDITAEAVGTNESADTVADRARTLISSYKDVTAKREHAEQAIVSLQKNVETLAPWGDFEPDAVARLEEKGLRMRFFTAHAKRFDFSVLDEITSDDVAYEIVNRKEATVYFVVVHKKELSLPAMAAEEVALPNVSLSTAQKHIQQYSDELRTYDRELQSLAARHALLAQFIEQCENKLSYERALYSMQESLEGRVISLTGWVPQDTVSKVTSFLENYSAWYQLDAPGPDDTVPVVVRNGWFARLFEPITKMYSLPDYFFMDPTPFFAPFFWLFFGLCLSDLGYGLIATVLAVGLMKMLPQNMKPIGVLGVLLGISVMIGGFFLNSFFGFTIFDVPGSGGGMFQQGDAFAFLSPVKTPEGITYYPAIPFSAYLGIIQIIIGIILRGYATTRYKRNALYVMHPVSEILMLLGAVIVLTKINFLDLRVLAIGPVTIGESIAALPFTAAWGLIGVGLVLLLLFNDPSKSIAVRIGLGFWALYQFITGTLMSNSLSYLRLFALGLGTGLLGAAFNQIALMLIRDESGTLHFASPALIGTVLILVLGHSVNLGLSGLSAFAHSLRLIFVEFYQNLDFKGTMKEYTPFSIKQSK
jgi:V/A-type H+-transporting ATPase subunit I